MQNLISIEGIEKRIFLIQGQRVMLDADLANLYGVPTKVLNQAVKRNRERFPGDFLFQLTLEEKQELVTICDRFKKLKHSSVLPHAFTEHGALMLANVLNSDRAIQVGVYVIRAFVKLREMFATHRALLQKLTELERKIQGHDQRIQTLFDAIRQLMTPPPVRRRKIGFRE